VNGVEEFKQYVSKIRAAFPDFHNHIEELIGEGDKIVARLTYTGTHRGELFGFSGTERNITYQDIAILQFREAKIVSGFVLGDTESLKRQIAQT
jgi:predicted ester cyclase